MRKVILMPNNNVELLTVIHMLSVQSKALSSKIDNLVNTGNYKDLPSGELMVLLAESSSLHRLQDQLIVNLVEENAQMHDGLAKLVEKIEKKNS
jgi:hypothetical protein